MAAKKPLYFDSTNGYPAEMAATDEVEFGLVTMGGNIVMATHKITGLGNGTDAQDAVTKTQLDAVASGIHIKELLLHESQLSNAEGVLKATVIQLDANLDGGEVISLKRGAEATEVFTEGVEFTKGVSIDLTMEALATAISAGTDFDAVTTLALDTIEPTNKVLVIRQNSDSAGALRVWQAGANTVKYNYINFALVTDYKGLAAQLIEMPTADPTSTNFGMGRALADLETNEAHLVRNNDTGYLWDDDAAIWQIYAIPGAYVAGNGISITGMTIAVKIDDTPDTLDADGDGLKVVGLPSTFKINDVAVGASVTAANLDDVVDGSEVDSATPLHVHQAAPKHTYVTGENLTAGDPVYISANNTMSKGDASNDTKSKIVGISQTTIASPGPAVIVSGGIARGVVAGATFNTDYWLQTGGGIGTAVPGAGLRLIKMGRALNATDILVAIEDFGKRAA